MYENLKRAELSPTEMAEHLAKRTELWDARQSAQVAPVESKRADGRGHRSEGFASETAAATGVNKSTINRALARAKAIPEDVRDQIKRTKLDTGTYLDWIKGMAPDDQREGVGRSVGGGFLVSIQHLSLSKHNYAAFFAKLICVMELSLRTMTLCVRSYGFVSVACVGCLCCLL